MIGQLIGLAGSVMSARAERAEGKMQRQASEYNAKLLRNKAENIKFAKEAETQQKVSDQRKFRAKQRAGFLSTGAMADEGTPLLVQLDEIANMQLDLLNDRRTREIQREGALSEAEMTLYEGRVAEATGKARSRATLLSGVGNFVSSLE